MNKLFSFYGALWIFLVVFVPFNIFPYCYLRKEEISSSQHKKRRPCQNEDFHEYLPNISNQNAEDVVQKVCNCSKCRGMCSYHLCRKKNWRMMAQITDHAVNTLGYTSVQKSEINISRDLRSLLCPSTFFFMEIMMTGKACHQVKEKGACPIKYCRRCLLLKNVLLLYFLRQMEAWICPKTTISAWVVGTDLEAKDVGLEQFSYMSSATHLIFQIRKGQPDQILQDIARCPELEVVPELIADFHKNLLSVIKEDRGEKHLIYIMNGDAWINDLCAFINEMTFMSKELHLECLNKGTSGCNKLSPCKLHIRNLLCDEALSTTKLIEEQNGRVAERSDGNAKVWVATAKEKGLRERLKNDMRGGSTPIE